jgi:polyisoprenoid-binding protein YceI
MRIVSLLLTVLAFTTPLAGQAQEVAASTEFRVDSDASWLRVLAYPDGPLRRFGHHHVIAHHGISGMVHVAPNPLDSTFELELGVAGLEVDDPAMRELEGKDFEKEVPQKDKDGTRANMLGEKLLDAEQFPTIRVQSSSIEGSMPDVTIVASMIVKGMEHTVRVPASIELTSESFVATGELEITHDALGLSPFTAIGGALQVRDLLIIKYEISGLRVTDGEQQAAQRTGADVPLSIAGLPQHGESE